MQYCVASIGGRADSDPSATLIVLSLAGKDCCDKCCQTLSSYEYSAP